MRAGERERERVGRERIPVRVCKQEKVGNMRLECDNEKGSGSAAMRRKNKCSDGKTHLRACRWSRGE